MSGCSDSELDFKQRYDYNRIIYKDIAKQECQRLDMVFVNVLSENLEDFYAVCLQESPCRVKQIKLKRWE